MRDAQSMLDRVISYAGKHISESAITEVLGIVARDILLKTSQALVDKDVNGCLATVNELFSSGYDIRQFYQAFLEHLRNMIVVKSSKNPDQLIDLTPDECDALRKQVKDSPVEILQRLFDVWLKAEGEIYHSSMPHIVLEMLLLKMVYLKGLVPLDDALAKLNDLEKEISTKLSASPEGVGCKELPYKEVEERSDVPAPLKEDAIPLTHKESIENDHNQSWEKFLTFTRNEKPMLAALLDHGKFLRMDDKTIELGFTPNSLFMESAQDKDNAQQLKKMFEEFFGRKMHVNITPLEEEEIIDASVQSGEKENESAGDNENDAVRNPLVNEALSIFDGKIIEVKYGEEGVRSKESEDKKQMPKMS
jgi:DNA polymerase-3 subunit gamma/tau